MFTPKDFSHLIGLDGFSDDLLKNHFALYEGYVKNTNALLELLKAKEIGTPEYSELQRRFGWEWNGMRLHELYFGNMTTETTSLLDGPIKEKIVSTYGSVENWRRQFVGIGSMRGIGWAMLVQDRESSELFNIWVNEHDGGHLSGAVPILVMDIFEHAFVLDYGLKRADYIESFFQSIDWNEVGKRFIA
jgi:Fe-Mn family superoxide dismutase